MSGGRSSRMGGQNKAFLNFYGESLISRIADRFGSQVSELYLNIAADQTEDLAHYQQLDVPLIPDMLGGAKGPLMGLASAFQYTNSRVNIAICPCDAPFVPSNLVSALAEYMKNQNAEVVCPSYEGFLQPTFALWDRSVAERVIEAATIDNVAGLKALYSELKFSPLEWPQERVNPFFNVNTRAELSLAKKL